MPNNPLMRDPATGRMLSRFETLARQNALAAQQTGQAGDEKALTGIQFEAQHDTPTVQSYVAKMLELVSAQNSVRGLREALGEIQTFVDQVLKTDTTMTLAEQKRLLHYAQQLQQVIRAKTSLLHRFGSRVREVGHGLREKTHNVLNKAAHGEAGHSLSFDALARVFADRGGKQKAALEARAEAFHGLAERRAEAQKGVPAKSVAPVQTEHEVSPTRVKTSAAGSSAADAGILKQILSTDTHILDELKGLRSDVQKQAAAALLAKDERDRLANDVAPTSPTRIEDAPEKGKKETSIFGKLAGLVGGLLTTLKAGLPGLFKAAFDIGSGVLTKLGGMLSSAVTSAYELISTSAATALRGALSIIPDAAALLSPFAVAAAQTWMASKLADVFNEIMQKYPMLKRGDKTFKDDAKAVTDLKGNIQNVLGATQAGKTIVPVGGFKGQPKDVNLPNETPAVSRDVNLPAETVVAGTPEFVPTIAPQIIPTLKLPTPSVTPTRERGAQHLSEVGINFIKKRETFSSKAYADGKHKDGSIAYAIGYGSHQINGREVSDIIKENPNFRITEVEADANLRSRVMREFVPAVRKQLTRPVSQTQFDALVSIAWNRGTGAFANDKTFLSKVNAGSVTAADFQQTFTTKNPDWIAGLQKRRQQEFALFTAEPSMNRAAGSLARATAAAGGTNITIVGPSTTVVSKGNTPSAPSVYVPVPMVTDNLEATLRALRSTNAM